MKLTLKASYLSIREFPQTELPSFTLITGVNGSGKTHLLKAIKDGNIRADCAPQIEHDIRLYDWTNLVPTDSGAFHGLTTTNERNNMIEEFVNHARVLSEQVLAAARGGGISGDPLSSISSLARLTASDIARITGDEARSQKIQTAIQGAIRNAGSQLLNQPGLRPYQKQIERVAESLARPPIALSREDLSSDDITTWGRVDLFQQSFARLFVTYRDLLFKNRLKQFHEATKHRSFGALTDQEFEARHMVAPWAFVNSAFKTAGLDFEIDSPDEFDTSPYQPILRKSSTGVEVKFGDLSSGEKILMSFAFCLYYASDKRQIASYPKLLLLDEVDAPLHPSMVRTLIRTISEVLVGKYGIQVIATTHSPSTVALAPDECLYAMYPDRPGLHRTNKAHALNVLTVGVPTMSISFNGRRQVFVESPVDAEMYDLVFQALKSLLGSERSLEFVATGPVAASTGTHVNTGCERVCHLVKELTDAGNQSVFGLIDWDGSNEPSSRVAVVAHGRRDGLENLLLDPLLVAALIVKDLPSVCDKIGLTSSLSYLDFLRLPPERLQPVVDSLMRLVLGENMDREKWIESRYVGGFSLRLNKDYLWMDDHRLETCILNAFPQLRSIAGTHKGNLLRHVAETVVRDQPTFLPHEAQEVFEDLLQRPAHSEIT